MSNTELRPCPFCGGKAGFVTKTSGYNNDSKEFGFVISCQKCKVEYPKRHKISVTLNKDGQIETITDERALAIAEWNGRGK